MDNSKFISELMEEKNFLENIAFHLEGKILNLHTIKVYTEKALKNRAVYIGKMIHELQNEMNQMEFPIDSEFKNSNNESEKFARGWTKRFRPDKQTFESVCPHGVGHNADIHGCDGCCRILAFNKD